MTFTENPQFLFYYDNISKIYIISILYKEKYCNDTKFNNS